MVTNRADGNWPVTAVFLAPAESQPTTHIAGIVTTPEQQVSLKGDEQLLKAMASTAMPVE